MRKLIILWIWLFSCTAAVQMLNKCTTEYWIMYLFGWILCNLMFRFFTDKCTFFVFLLISFVKLRENIWSQCVESYINFFSVFNNNFTSIWQITANKCVTLWDGTRNRNNYFITLTLFSIITRNQYLFFVWFCSGIPHKSTQMYQLLFETCSKQGWFHIHPSIFHPPVSNLFIQNKFCVLVHSLYVAPHFALLLFIMSRIGLVMQTSLE